MPDIGGSVNDAFGAGINHVRNPGRANVGSITLGTDAGLEQTSQQWDSMVPHGVLRTALDAGSPADTDAGVEFGQQAVGNRDDAEQAGQSMNRALMQRAASIGTDDNTL